MVRKITGVVALVMVTGCGLGQPIQAADNANAHYKACIIDQVPLYSARERIGEAAPQKTEEVTEFAVSKCMAQEDAYVAAMTAVAMAMTGDLVSPEKFLEDEEATMRHDLHAMAARLVDRSL